MEITRDEIEGLEESIIHMRKELLETIESQQQRIADLETKVKVLVDLLVQGGDVDRSVFEFRCEAALDAAQAQS